VPEIGEKLEAKKSSGQTEPPTDAHQFENKQLAILKQLNCPLFCLQIG
jgi:hypothetical protein